MRYITPNVGNDLKNKMVFIGGPRQVGKTTLAKSILKTSTGRYLNWDFDDDRQDILQKNGATMISSWFLMSYTNSRAGNNGLRGFMT